MKKSKKLRVSWPSDSMLCQVKMFQREDCPAKVASSNVKASNLPPGFETSAYPTMLNMSHIPRIKWKCPPKFILNDALLVASGGESTETRCENLRIAKVLEAFYPYRSVIPSCPGVSSGVEDESYDDSKTPNIPLTPIGVEPVESCHTSSSPAAVSNLGPDLSLAALSAFLKTKEESGLIDTDLLVKLLSDPNIVKNLMNDKAIETDTRLVPQHVTSSAMDRSQAVPHVVPVSVQSSVPVATRPVSTAQCLSMNLQKPPLVFHTCGVKPLPRLEDSLRPSPVDDVVVSEQKPVTKPQPQSLDISRVRAESAPQISNGMNIKQDDQVVKNMDYFKNLIREHGVVNQPTNKGRADGNNNMKLVKAQTKVCIYFGRGRGCKRGDSCFFLHDHDRSKRPWTDVAPTPKRLKFGS
uniref:Zinc finger CCCH domain-containing protein 68 n=1 Tax=Noccaea caerulescens TaxID=107243 RepID=A0A1J3FCA6_NOCCA